MTALCSSGFAFNIDGILDLLVLIVCPGFSKQSLLQNWQYQFKIILGSLNMKLLLHHFVFGRKSIKCHWFILSAADLAVLNRLGQDS